MASKISFLLLFTVFICSLPLHKSYATIDKIRAILREDPTTTITIAWNQVSGQNPILHYGRIYSSHKDGHFEKKAPSAKSIQSKGMNTHFVHLSNLQPNTQYYFLIEDSEGISQTYYFRTASDDAKQKLSFAVGGNAFQDRNNNINSNKMIAKLNLDFVLFDGNMTANNSNEAWQNWLDDWQKTIGADGKITPIIPAAGNEEESRSALVNLFDIKNEDLYYALTFGKGLLRLYTLNSFQANNAKQKDWLENDLNRHQQAAWRIAQYHHHLRQHTSEPIANEQLKRIWGNIFQIYKMDLAIESELVFNTFTKALKTSTQNGHEEGFVLDEQVGTHFLSAGAWSNINDLKTNYKKWTENAESHANFNWILLDLQKLEIRTVYTDNVDDISALNNNNRYTIPSNLKLANYNGNTVHTLVNKSSSTFVPQDNQSGVEISKISARVIDNKVHLSWAAFCELQGANFHIQSSTNKLSWSSVTFLKVRHTNPQDGFFQYEYKSEIPDKGGKLFYRITILDSLGKEKVKRDVELRTLGNEKMEQIQASITNGQLIVDFDLTKDQDMLLEILDTKLNPVFIQKLPYLRGRHTIPLNLRHLPSGYYLLEISYGQFLYRKNIHFSRLPIAESLK